MFILLILGLQAAHAAAPSVAPQLNVRGFASCLAEQESRFDFPALQREHQLGRSDLLLLFLSVYPGRRLPAVGELQDRAHERWARAWEDREERLALSLVGHAKLVPGRLWAEALVACPGGDLFCASLISHNVLRTLGRHAQASYRDRSGRVVDLNPRWFTDHRDAWLARARLIQESMISLRSDGQGDRWGEWYHFFGILNFSVHEVALQGHLHNVDAVVRLNEVLNPLLAGGQEEPEKARLDRDSVAVAATYLSGGTDQSGSCDDEAAYVEKR